MRAFLHHILVLRRPVYRKWLLLICCLVLAEWGAYAQCTRQIRKYADERYFTSGFVNNPGNATDKNVSTYSTLSIFLTGTSRQWLEFDERIPAGTRVFIKVSTFNGLAGVLPNFTIQGYVTGSGGVRNGVTPLLQDAQVLGLINGDGSLELSFVPSQDFDGVVVSISAVLGVSYNMKVYDAYILRNTSSSLNCNSVLDVLYGVVPGLNALGLGTINNPWNAADADLTSYADWEMTLNVGIMYETVIFNTPSVPGDSIRVMLEQPTGNLLDLLLLGNFSIQPYLGTTAVGPPLTNAATGLQLRLLAPGSPIHVITAAISGSFDRVEIRLSALAGALLKLKIYDVSRLSPLPVSYTLSGSAGPSPVCITQTGNIRLAVTSPEACATYRWYNGTTQIGTGSSIVPSITSPGSYTFYVESQRMGCTNTEARAPVPVTVVPKAGPPALTIQNNP